MGDDRVKYPAQLSWEPPSDVIVTSEEVIVIVDIAGMDGESIDVVTDGARLRISGVRGSACCDGARQYHQIEIQIGRFSREIDLPVPVDHTKTSARYDRGMLEVRIAREDPEERVRKVEIE
jgi:HSP20 family protein